MLYLAARGWLSVGLDNRSSLLTNCQHLCLKYNLLCRVTVCRIDIRQGVPFRRGTFDVVNICRFIHRESLPSVLSLLKVGGHLVYSHFLEGCEHTPVGHPKTSDGYFYRKELEQMLTANGFVILIQEETTLSDTRPFVNILAEKL
ncbi:type 12 methyltransferase [Angomonas deanei]|nr:type 12 methyltransferase [Angomonas deanei]|eukprot:EPY42203.1 type 12 methyltransferase [Angomonas deanei]